MYVENFGRRSKIGDGDGGMLGSARRLPPACLWAPPRVRWPELADTYMYLRGCDHRHTQNSIPPLVGIGSEETTFQPLGISMAVGSL